MIYIKFNDPKPDKKLPADGKIKKAIKYISYNILTSIIPKANPDFEHLLDKVEYWKIEFNTKENYTWREIGFDKDGNSILAMPLGNNHGYWTDNRLTIKEYENFDSVTIANQEFERDWTEFEKKYKQLTLANNGS